MPITPSNSNNMPTEKKQAKDRKGGPKTKPQKKKMLEELKEIFLLDGMTAYQASQQTEYDFKTVQNYFNQWADEIIDAEGHEDWVEREARVRTRSLEGVSKKLTTVRERLTKLHKILDELIDTRTLLTSKEKQKDKKIQKIIDSLDSDKTEKLNVEVERYERIVRLNDIMSSELQQQYDAIEMMPPAEAILDRELEKLIAEKQAVFAKRDSESSRQD